MEQTLAALDPTPGSVFDIGGKGKKGSAGKPVKLVTNFVQVRILEEKRIYVYDVVFEPKLVSPKARKDVLSRLNLELGSTYLFDGKKLYLPFKLETSEANGSLELNCANKIDPDRPLLVRLTPAIHQKQARFTNEFFEVLIDCLLSLLTQTPMKDGRLTSPIHLEQHKLRIEPGMRVMMRVSDLGPMLCFEPTNFMLRTSTLLDALKLIKEPCGNEFENIVTEKYVGKFVLAKNSMTYYRIDDIIWDMTPRSPYEYNERLVTIADFYQLEYQVKIKDMDQPIFVSRMKKRSKANLALEPVIKNFLVVLLPELCHVSGISDEMHRSKAMMADVHRHTKVPPNVRTDRHEMYLNKMHANLECKALLDSWGVGIEEQMLEITGRVISGPVLKLNSKAVRDFRYQEKPRVGSVESLVGRQDHSEFFKEKIACYRPVNVTNWVIVCSKEDFDAASRLKDKYVEQAALYGIEVTGGQIVPVECRESSGVDNFISAIRRTTVSGETQLVLLIIPKGLNASLYGPVKRLCLLELGVAAQCIRIGCLRGVACNGIVGKVALQINCKLGGALWALSNPTNEALMFVGLDTYHDVRRMNQSVFAMVASLDPECTKYSTRTCSQKLGQETCNEIIPMFTRQLREYYEVCGRYPTKILIFRDGISNAYLGLLKKFELAQFRSSIQTIVPSPKIVFMVFQKRTVDRFFRLEPFLSYPVPGTIVDHMLTRTEYRDFLLISQLIKPNANALPSRCIVLEEDAEEGVESNNDYAQQMTYASTFMYYNWQGSIKVPAVCQYAHKAASLIGRILKRDPDPKMTNKLYYL